MGLGLVEEVAVVHDAVGVVEREVAAERGGFVDFDHQVHIEVDKRDLDRPSHRSPSIDDEPRLLGHLATKRHDRRLPIVNDATWSRPVDRAIASTVGHEQQPAAISEETSGDLPSTHTVSMTGGERLGSSAADSEDSVADGPPRDKHEGLDDDAA